MHSVSKLQTAVVQLTRPRVAPEIQFAPLCLDGSVYLHFLLLGLHIREAIWVQKANGKH